MAHGKEQTLIRISDQGRRYLVRVDFPRGRHSIKVGPNS